MQVTQKPRRANDLPWPWSQIHVVVTPARPWNSPLEAQLVAALAQAREKFRYCDKARS